MARNNDSGDWYDKIVDWILLVVVVILSIKSCTHFILVKDQVVSERGEFTIIQEREE